MLAHVQGGTLNGSRLASQQGIPPRAGRNPPSLCIRVSGREVKELIGLGEVFEPLKDPKIFQSFSINDELKTIVWPTGADLAPEFLYQQAVA